MNADAANCSIYYLDNPNSAAADDQEVAFVDNDADSNHNRNQIDNNIIGVDPLNDDDDTVQ